MYTTATIANFAEASMVQSKQYRIKIDIITEYDSILDRSRSITREMLIGNNFWPIKIDILTKNIRTFSRMKNFLIDTLFPSVTV